MKWFLVYMCDEDTINTSTTYEDLVFANDEEEAKKLACVRWLNGFVCIGVKVATVEEISRLNNKNL